MKIETNTNADRHIGVKGVIACILMFLAFMWVLWLMGGSNAKAQDRTLQETVETAQKVYDQNQTLATTALKTYCESYLDLAVAKNQLTAKLQIHTNMIPVDIDSCTNLTVPTSF